MFGGSGIRGIRYKKEIDGVGDVSINDISPLANEFTRINAELNEVEVEIDQKEANNELRSNMGRFDVIDIDPFGTPSPFVDSAGYNLKRDSPLPVFAEHMKSLALENTMRNHTKANIAMKTALEFSLDLLHSLLQSIRNTLKLKCPIAVSIT